MERKRVGWRALVSMTILVSSATRCSPPETHAEDVLPPRDVPASACGDEPPGPDNPFCTIAEGGPRCLPEEGAVERWHSDASGQRQEREMPSEDCEPECEDEEVCVVPQSADLCCGDLNEVEE